MGERGRGDSGQGHNRSHPGTGQLLLAAEAAKNRFGPLNQVTDNLHRVKEPLRITQKDIEKKR